MLTLITFCLLSYGIGSISTAILTCRLKGLPDPRTFGSKNPGATNVAREGGKSLAIWVVLGDALKGYIPVMIAGLFLEGFSLGLVAVSAVLGHMFPIFFDFKGGKGIATTFGALLALSSALGLALILTWIAITALFRYSSLSGIVTAILAPIYAYWLTDHAYIHAIVFLSALILFRHRENIQRLIHGKEEKIK